MEEPDKFFEWLKRQEKPYSVFEEALRDFEVDHQGTEAGDWNDFENAFENWWRIYGQSERTARTTAASYAADLVMNDKKYYQKLGEMFASLRPVLGDNPKWMEFQLRAGVSLRLLLARILLGSDPPCTLTARDGHNFTAWAWDQYLNEK